MFLLLLLRRGYLCGQLLGTLLATVNWLVCGSFSLPFCSKTVFYTISLCRCYYCHVLGFVFCVRMFSHLLAYIFRECVFKYYIKKHKKTKRKPNHQINKKTATRQRNKKTTRVRFEWFDECSLGESESGNINSFFGGGKRIFSLLIQHVPKFQRWILLRPPHTAHNLILY